MHFEQRRKRQRIDFDEQYDVHRSLDPPQSNDRMIHAAQFRAGEISRNRDGTSSASTGYRRAQRPRQSKRIRSESMGLTFQQPVGVGK
jgi:hypothetical protein